MGIKLNDYEKETKLAIKRFWKSRNAATDKQAQAGVLDQGTRGAVTAGKNMDGFADMLENLVRVNGLKEAEVVKVGKLVTLPGYFRPTKMWDLLVIHEEELVAAIEFKSQVGSLGNNFNNRTEEAIGTAHDLSVAFQEGAFGEQVRPFIGWFMLLEDVEKSRNPVKDNSPHFPTFPEFNQASYSQRYDILCKKMVQEQLYSSACLLLSPATAVKTGKYNCLSEMTNLKTFVTSFAGHIAAVSARKK